MLRHYAEQIIQFGCLQQFSREITEALHKPLKDTYRQSNKVDASTQVLDTHACDNAIKMLELNLCTWGKQLKYNSDIEDVIGTIGDRQGQAKTTEYLVLVLGQRKPDKVREGLSALTQAL